jgi:hypothetical protein
VRWLRGWKAYETYERPRQREEEERILRRNEINAYEKRWMAG